MGRQIETTGKNTTGQDLKLIHFEIHHQSSETPIPPEVIKDNEEILIFKASTWSGKGIGMKGIFTYQTADKKYSYKVTWSDPVTGPNTASMEVQKDDWSKDFTDKMIEVNDHKQPMRLKVYYKKIES